MSGVTALDSAPPQRDSLWPLLRQFRREWWVVGLFSFVANLMMLAPSLYMLQVFDRVMVSQNGLTLLLSTLILVYFLLLMGLSEWFRSRLLVRLGVRLDQRLSPTLFAATFDQQLRQPRPNPAQPFSDLTTLRQFLTGNGVLALFDAPWLPIYLAVLFLLHPTLGWIGVAFATLLALVALLSHRVTSQPLRQVLQRGVDLDSEQQGALRNAETIEALGMLPALQQRWWQRYRQQQIAQEGVDQRSRRLAALSKFLRFSQQSLSLGAGGWLVIHGELTAGAMIAGNILMTRALQPIDLLVNTWRALAGARSAASRLSQLLAASHRPPSAGSEPPPQGDDSSPLTTDNCTLQLQQVSVTAPNRQQPILHHLDLTLHAGTITLLIGPSGSGKSTLARTLLGLWSPQQGRITIAGVSPADWSAAQRHAGIGYLPQDVELLEGSVAENIARFGEVDAAQVIAAAEQAGVHQLILRFAQGYDTPIGGRNGVPLSAGQRQRIALARALYGDPPLLILDEPNASLDEAGEQALLQALQQLRARQRTVLVISHRRNLMAVADRLLQLDAGQIAADRSLPLPSTPTASPPKDL